jgi:hypothetical protein
VFGEHTGAGSVVACGTPVDEGVDDAGAEDHALEQRVGGQSVGAVHA